MTDSQVVLERLIGLHPKKIDLSLGRVLSLLGRLGDPHKKLPPVVHVAGTNGKGSTIAYMRAVIEAAGHTAHVYTSPHLVHFHERIRLGTMGGGQLVSEDQLVKTLRHCEQVNAGDQITFFEITTVAAFLLFAEHQADYVLLESGLGGRFDATNVIDRPAAAVITPISFDHEAFLGNTITAIAGEKAGILKPGTPAIVAPQRDEALAVVEKTAASLRAPVHLGGRDWTVFEEHGRLVYQDGGGLLDLPLPRLAGRHQITNLGTAIATLRAIAPDLGEDALARGIPTADWPGRMQRITGKVSDLAPIGAEVWLDGGHNPDGGRAVATTVAELEERVSRPLVMIVGMLTSKAPDRVLRNFQGLAAKVYAIAIEREDASFDPKTLAEQAESAGLDTEPAANLDAALARIRATAWPVPPRILIYGSLYLAGEVLERDGTIPD